MLAAEKHKGTFMAPIGIGLSLFVAEITGKYLLFPLANPTDHPSHANPPRTQHPNTPTGIYFTGGSLNPARSFGPAVINRSFVGYHWIYWAGPLLGAVVAAGFYKFIKILEYETANPGQDDAHAAEAELKAHQTRVLSNGTTVFGSVATGPGANSQVDEPSGTAAGGEKLGEGFGAGAARVDGAGTGAEISPTATADGGIVRPALPRQMSSRARVESPAMGTADDAFYGLAHGMHGEDRNDGLQAALAVPDGARLRTATRSPGQVV